jgi:hypothetical protein
MADHVEWLARQSLEHGYSAQFEHRLLPVWRQELTSKSCRSASASIATTADLYVHVPPHVDQEAADRTANYIFGTSRD